MASKKKVSKKKTKTAKKSKKQAKKQIKKKTTKKAVAQKSSPKKQTKKAATKKLKSKKAGSNKSKPTKTVEKTASKKINTQSAKKSAAPKKAITNKKMVGAESDKMAAALLKASKKTQNEATAEPGILPPQQIKSIERIIRQERPWGDLQKYLTNPAKYKMTSTYHEKMVIDHKTMGVGFIVSVENNRMKVLFSEGVKNLIMNYMK